MKIAKVIPVRGETFLMWLRALASIPTQYGADLYVSMKHELAFAIEKAATASPADEE